MGMAGLVAVSGGITWFALGRSQSSPGLIPLTTSPSHSIPTPLPTRVPLGTTLLTYNGHQCAVFAAPWSPDGKHIASASYDRTVHVWNVADGTLVYSYLDHVGASTVVWSPDGTRIASGGDTIYGDSDHTVQVWDASDGGHLFIYRGHSAAVHAIAWKGTRIASASGDGTVKVWDAIDGGHVVTYRGHSSVVNAVAWSPNGALIASGSADNTVQVWDATNGTPVYTYRGHVHSGPTIVNYNGVNAVVWSPNGARIASASGTGFAFGKPDNTVQVWQASTGTHLYTYTGHSAWLHTARWSPDGTRIASGGEDSLVKVWQAV